MMRGGGVGSKYHYKRAIISLSAFPRHADDGSTLKAGSVALRFFRGGGGDPCPTMNPRMMPEVGL